MNDTIMHYIMYLATFIYLAYVTIYIIKNIPQQREPLEGLVFTLDIIRYTSMFLSFMLTMYFGTEWGNELISSQPLDPLETILAYGFTILASASSSALISSLLLYSERAITSGNMSRLQLYTVVAIYFVVATMDFLTLSFGGGSIAESFARAEITRLEIKQDTSSTLIIDTKEEIVRDLREEIKTVKRDIKSIDSTGLLIRTKRVRTLNATLARCAKKNKACPDTNAELAQIIKNQHNKKLDQLNKKRSTLQNKLLTITNSYESTASNIKTEKSKAIEKIETELKETKWWITFASIIFVMVNLFLAFVRGILATTLEVKVEEETGEVAGLSTKEKRHYIFEAMKQRAFDLQMQIREDSPIGSEGLAFPRDKIRAKAIYLAGKDKKIMTIGKDAALDLIIELKKRGGEIERWLVTRSWNMFDPNDSNYTDDLAAQ